MRIAYFANAESTHDCNWINYFASDPANYVVVFCSRNQSTELLYPNVKIHKIIPRYSYFSFFERKTTLKNIRKLLQKHEIELIHSLYGISICFWAYQLRFTPHIITTRGSDVLEDYVTNYRNPKQLTHKISYPHAIRMIEDSYNHADIVISTSKGQQEIIREFLSDPEKMHLVRTGVDVEQMLSQLKTTKKRDHSFTVFSTRYMQTLYNIDVIVKAASEIKDRIPGFKLKLINHFPGSEYADSITSLVTELGLSKSCEILPPQSFQEMVEQYRHSDVVVMIPNSDGTPVSGIEAMIARVPLVIGRFKYDDDLFNEKTVWQLKENSPSCLAAKLMEIYHSDEATISSKTNQAFDSACALADRRKEMGKLKRIYQTLNVKYNVGKRAEEVKQ
jgi:glycosyltransferase involved in cell wall biosynthesis